MTVYVPVSGESLKSLIQSFGVRRSPLKFAITDYVAAIVETSWGRCLLFYLKRQLAQV